VVGVAAIGVSVADTVSIGWAGSTSIKEEAEVLPAVTRIRLFPGPTSGIWTDSEKLPLASVSRHPDGAIRTPSNEISSIHRPIGNRSPFTTSVSPGIPDDGLTLMLGSRIDAVESDEGVGTDTHPINISINLMQIDMKK
jgi:hypothetical protein